LIELVVLVLEQDVGRRDELDKALTKAGYQIRFAPDGEALLYTVSADPPHLIILDVDLPRNEAMGLLKTIHDIQPGVPVICEATDPTVEGAVEAMRRGAYNYISKFSPVKDLLDKISHALERERMEVETREKAQEHRVRTFDDPASLAAIDRILSESEFSRAKLISYLQDIQQELNYLPQDALRFVARRVNVSLPRIYSIATFYKAFSLLPRGRHIIQVCLGTACHVRGAMNILQSFERELGIKAGETTYDNRFSLESVRCVGCCGLAPVFIVDGKFYGKLTQDRVPQIIDTYT
jgi:NADH:ubiquinone oxidoreductase subunit E/CheY-like chemotaxis protein